MSQMGSAVTVASAIWEKDPNGCAVDPANYKLGLVMYVSYFWLFFGAPAPSILSPCNALHSASTYCRTST
jgi:hypothetical protein